MRRTASICVPVRNERRNLPGLFAALARLRADGDPPLVSVAFDGCSDGSEALAFDLAREHGLELAIVRLDRLTGTDAGRARAAALSLGRRDVRRDGILLTTDADTRPNADWLQASRAALARADLACGYIQRRSSSDDDWRAAIESYLDRLHAAIRAVDPVAGDAEPSHWHEGGASLAITARGWDTIGGAALPATGEDREIVRRARLAGLIVRQDPAIRVRTSARLQGRAEGGLADALRSGREQARAGVTPLMEHPDDVIARARRSAIARAAFPPRDPADLANRIGVSFAAIAAAAADARSADAFTTALPLADSPHRAVPLADAARLLIRHERGRLECAA